ncbi:hypothetical protein C2L71_02360 [Enteroscipio rubneri]|uniref:Uncharacterized protein n=1 Tax=Enteroscipio rubneri TaxID=2070686 RepID=A0A2K2UES3_9ACTN|nr:hypothetical protein C2L71_02360 [Enteroscipio rubneri]
MDEAPDSLAAESGFATRYEKMERLAGECGISAQEVCDAIKAWFARVSVSRCAHCTHGTRRRA